MAQRVESDLDFGGASRITNLPAPAADNDAARRVDLLFGQAFHIADVKAFNVFGGTFTEGAPRTRDLTTRIYGSGSVSLASNQFTPIAGTWLISWSSPARAVARHWTSLVNATAETTVQVGSAQYTLSSATVSVSSGCAVVVCNGTDAFEIQHECQTTFSTSGFGLNTNKSGVDSIYTQVFGTRIA